jgi:predicted nucleotidyltransferase
VLTEHQQQVSSRVLDEESEKRRHLVVSLSGAHAYGFPSPDSDLDLKAIHIAPTARLLGLQPDAPPADRLQIIEGVEIDYTSNELGGVLAGLLQGNGNYFERILGPLPIRSSREHEELRPIAARALSRRVHRHYRGFATSQLREFEASPKAKKILYVLRTALTGVHALVQGEIVPDLTRIMDLYGFGEARELIERKKAGERADLDEPMREKWRREVARALVLLDEKWPSSPLPEEPANRAELESWLIEIRRRYF